MLGFQPQISADQPNFSQCKIMNPINKVQEKEGFIDFLYLIHI